MRALITSEAPTVQQSIDYPCPPDSQQQTCSSGSAAVGQCLDRRTDTDGHRTVTSRRLPRNYAVAVKNSVTVARALSECALIVAI